MRRGVHRGVQIRQRAQVHCGVPLYQGVQGPRVMHIPQQVQVHHGVQTFSGVQDRKAKADFYWALA